MKKTQMRKLFGYLILRVYREKDMNAVLLKEIAGCSVTDAQREELVSICNELYPPE